MALRDVIGQDKAINILLGTIQKGRIPSSYLFAGESGIGKKFTAINLAKTLNCLNPTGKATDCCDECPSCRKIDACVHPDFLLILPKDGQIKIEEIRAISDMLSFKPFEGRKKIIIVDEANTMNPYAANAFLKTLEEPPEFSLIILISSNPDSLPDTIRSRCWRVNFAPLSDKACKEVIKRTVSAGSQLSTLLRLSMGRPARVTSEDLIGKREWFIKLMQGMLNAEKHVWASKEEMERWFEFMLIFLRDIATAKVTQDEAYLINIDLKDYIKKLSTSVDLEVIVEKYQRLNELKGYFGFNLNKSLVWNYTACILRGLKSKVV